MRPKPDLKKLRQSISKAEQMAPVRGETVSLGPPALDAALPGGGLGMGALHEFLPAAYGDLAALTGFSFGVLAQIIRMRSGLILFAAPRYHLFQEGACCPLGFTAFGCDPNRLVQLRAPKTQNVLWALEEGLENPAVAAVVGILPDQGDAYDFTASRRLALRAAENGVTALILRSHHGAGMATAAQTRWSIAAAPSAPHHWAGGRIPGLGAPQWQVNLIKSKTGALGGWRIGWDDETFSFCLAAALADRTAPQERVQSGERRTRWAVA